MTIIILTSKFLTSLSNLRFALGFWN